MSALGWAIVFSLPLYAVVQLVLLVVLGRRLTLRGGEVPPRRRIWNAGGPSRNGDARSGRAPSVVCPACGSENDPAYTYCNTCVGRLSPGAAPTGRRTR